MNDADDRMDGDNDGDDKADDGSFFNSVNFHPQ